MTQSAPAHATPDYDRVDPTTLTNTTRPHVATVHHLAAHV